MGFFEEPISINSRDHLRNLIFVLTGINGDISAQKMFKNGYFQVMGNCLNLSDSASSNPQQVCIFFKETRVKGLTWV